MVCLTKNQLKGRIEYEFVMSSIYEYNLSNIVNSVLGASNFVISIDSQYIDFNISGKYFRINIEDIQEYNDVYAYIDSFDDGCLNSIAETTKLIVTGIEPKDISPERYLYVSHKEHGVFTVPPNEKLFSKAQKFNIDDGILR